MLTSILSRDGPASNTSHFMSSGAGERTSARPPPSPAAAPCPSCRHREVNGIGASPIPTQAAGKPRHHVLSSGDMQNICTHKEVDSHGNADRDNEATHQPGIDLARVVRSTIAADDSADDHEDCLGPENRPRDDKGDHSYAIDAGR